MLNKNNHMENSEVKIIANTIFENLGGNKFLAMTGTKNLSYSQKDGCVNLTMHLKKNKISAKYLIINLEKTDTYTMVFLNKNFEQVEKSENVYADQLQSMFQKITDLKTHL